MTGVAYELAEKDVCCIEEQSIFDQVYSLVRCLHKLLFTSSTPMLVSLSLTWTVAYFLFI